VAAYAQQQWECENLNIGGFDQEPVDQELTSSARNQLHQKNEKIHTVPSADRYLFA